MWCTIIQLCGGVKLLTSFVETYKVLTAVRGVVVTVTIEGHEKIIQHKSTNARFIYAHVLYFCL